MNIPFMGWDVQQFIRELGPDFPLLSEYADTEQDPDWHAEGDVEIHTNMVLDEAYAIVSRESLGRERSIQLILAALFHDYGKPLTTKPIFVREQDRIGAPSHEAAGASLLIHEKPPFGLSAADWLGVVHLVAYHHIPKKLVVKNAPAAKYAELTRRVSDIELLYWLEIADMAGRVCEDRQEQIDNIELFKLMAQSHGVWGVDPYENVPTLVKDAFPDLGGSDVYRLGQQMMSRYEDGQIFMLEEEIARAYGYKDGQSHVVVLCGLPGVGKSTFVRRHYPHYDVVSMDAIRLRDYGSGDYQGANDEVRRTAMEELKDHLRNGRNIVWDGTNFVKDFRSPVIQTAYNYGAFVETVVLYAPLQEIKASNRNRDYVVPEARMDKMAASFQMPDIAESHALRFVPRT